MDNLIVQMINENQETLKNNWLDEVNIFKEKELVAASTTMKLSEETDQQFFELLIKHINYHDISKDGTLDQFFDQVLHTGLPLSYLTQGLQAARRVIVNFLVERISDKERLITIYREIDTWLDPILNRVVENSSQIWERTVSIQKTALLELTAPLIPVFQNISVMPLIGSIDTERAKLIMENLLNGVIKYRSEVVLIDITGVPVVDTMVAHHIIQAADAVRLLGSKCILVGIRPEIAQTIVSLGIDLSLFPTKSSLQKGMESALEYTNQKLVSNK
ncbi:STAS domain-containing protein [Fictibacillus barbaricus]|uniref:RsbT co-antagonist protein RsbR n=1 Tax=Fictibacillus barbaricus TaxID=182136 RepID=A0ABU1U690_9BACL|nr:STAS domain-containing protein [Fictibacillus barbaricus]MDR7074893.1 rsbT co-antagonist protein RsbR [Fictibacillus barbaricus]